MHALCGLIRALSVRQTENFGEKKGFLMARSGRPRANLEKAILAEMSENLKRIAVMVAEKLKSSEHSRARMTFEAACLLLILEHGTDYEKARCEPLIRRLRETKWGQSNDPYRKLPDRDFWKILFNITHRIGIGGRTRPKAKSRIRFTSEKTSGSRKRTLRMCVGRWRSQTNFARLTLPMPDC